MSKKIIAGAIGNCVHVAGVIGFLRVAEELGYETEFLGAAVSIDEFIKAIKAHDPDIVGISYRLTPDVSEKLLKEFRSAMEAEGLHNRRFAFGGTPPVCEVANRLGWFEQCFDGLENPDKVWSYLGQKRVDIDSGEVIDRTLINKLAHKAPYPIIRHHFGLSNLEETIDGVKKIAESGTVDVISVAPDQNAQESFFHPECMDPMMDGAGGAPVRTEADLRRIYDASQHGNHPLLRIYSGTKDLINWAELAVDTINNAWGAIPLCWYSALDGRSDRTPAQAIRENQEAMRWYGERDIPVEVNEAHHWSMRDAHDTIAVVMAYLAAYNAKAMGVKHYIAQYMFNSPPTMSASMDLAKMLAKIELIESLHDDNFTSYRQVRAGLLHLSPRQNIAKGQLAASTMLALQIDPSIIHVVGYCEGDHAAKPEEVIESCEIVQGVLRNCLGSVPDMKIDAAVTERKEELLSEARILLEVISSMQTRDMDPFIDPELLALAIKTGVIDAPQLRGNRYAAGSLKTKPVKGALYATDSSGKKIIGESERLAGLIKSSTVLSG